MSFKSYKTKILGIPVTVAPPEELEKVSYVVCGSTSYFADDVHATCGCGAAIVHRPYVPKTPPKICSECFVAMNGRKH